MSVKRQDLSNADVGTSGPTPEDITDPGGLQRVADAMEGMITDIGPDSSMEEKEREALANAEPEDISGQNDLDPIPGRESDDGEVTAESEGEALEVQGPETEEAGYDESEDALYTVKVQGEEREVSLSELRQGYMLQADYTRKTQALAQQRHEFEAEMNAVRAERQQYQQLLGNLEQQLASGMEQEPDWVDLARTDPVRYTQLKADWDQKQRVLQAANQERQRVQQAEQDDFQRRMQAYNQQQREALLAQKPELTDPQKAREYQQSLVEYAQNQFGVNPAELAVFTDHRAVLLLEKAMLFDQSQQKGAQVQQKVKAKANKVVRPGAAKGNGVVRSRSLRQANERLSRTGDVRDAAKVFESFV